MERKTRSGKVSNVPVPQSASTSKVSVEEARHCNLN